MPRKPRTNAQKNAGTNLATETVKSADRHRRFKEILDLLEDGRSGGEIVRVMMERHGLSERMCYEDLRNVYARCRADDAADEEIRKERARRQWDAQVQRCLKAGQLQAANYALERRHKLDGLFAPTKVEVSGSVSIAVDVQVQAIVGVLSPEDLADLRRINEKIAKAKAAGLLHSGDAPAAVPSGAAPEDA